MWDIPANKTNKFLTNKEKNWPIKAPPHLYKNFARVAKNFVNLYNTDNMKLVFFPS